MTPDQTLLGLPRYQFAAKVLHELVQKGYIAPGCPVMDWACGDGYGTKYLRIAGFNAWGLDVDKDAITYGKKWNTPHLIGSQLEEPDLAWQAVVCLDVVQYLPLTPAEVLDTLLVRVAKHAIVSVPFLKEPVHPPASAWHRLCEADFFHVNAKLDFFFQHLSPRSACIDDKREDVDHLIIVAKKLE